MQKGIRGFVILIVALAAVRFLIMATSSVFEPSEARYAAISLNMARSNDFVTPRFMFKGEETEFQGKPPLYFQLGGLACKALPSRPGLAVRLPAFGSAVLIVLFLFLAVRRFCGSESAWYAAAVATASPVFYIASGFCMTDMLLSLAIVGAWLAWFVFDQTGRKGFVVTVCAFLGIGMLVKGPIAVVLFGLPVLAWTVICRRWSALAKGSWAWFAGLAVFLAISVPWFAIRECQDPGFLNYFFVNENFLRFVRHDYGDKFGAGREFFRGMALVWTLVISLPWILVVAWDWFRSHRRPFFRPVPDTPSCARLFHFALLCVACVTLFWCLTSRVPFQYLLPAAPMAALAFALLPRTRLGNFALPAIGIALMIILPCVPFLSEHTGWKMPRKLFESVPALIPDGAHVSVAGSWAYAAEFYLGDRAVGSVDADGAHYLLARVRDASQAGKGRAELARGCGWILYSPRERDWTNAVKNATLQAVK